MSESRIPHPEIRVKRSAVIGVGSLGRHHARNYAELVREGRVQFAGVCDVDPENRAKVSEDYGCNAFANWNELLDKTDLVSIATPTETHCEIACAFLEKGVH